jgi:predicted DNA-binding mobile mystery protein A
MKKTAQMASKARQHLDRRLKDAQPLRQMLATPNQGWIRAIRQALGMTAEQLGRRVGISQPTLTGMEASEINGSIRLATLRRVAEGMNCTLVYALVPNAPLEEIVQERARKVAAAQLRPVEHTMMLENQSLSEAEREEFVKNYIRTELPPSLLWR